MFGESEKFENLNLFKDICSTELKEKTGVSFEHLQIKPMRTRALDSYWYNLIKKSKELEEIGIPDEENVKKVRAAMWPEFFNSTLMKIGDMFSNKLSVYRNNTIYLSPSKFYSMVNKTKTGIFNDLANIVMD